MLGLMKITFEFYDEKIVKVIYLSFVRPNLKFASSVWNPHLKSDIKLLESVQHRPTKLQNLKKMNYKEILKNFDLTDLHTRRTKRNFIQM
jgi:hypothetical protein